MSPIFKKMLSNRKYSSFVIILIFINLTYYGGIFPVRAEINGDIIVDPISFDVTIDSGSLKKFELQLQNAGSATHNYELRFASNLKIDEHTIALWDFNEGNGTTVFDATGNFHGDVHGAQWVQGKFDKALEFDGVNDYVVVSNTELLDLESITIETWIKLDHRLPPHFKKLLEDEAK